MGEGGTGARTRRIAVAVAGGLTSLHFGHCDQFALFDVNREGRRIVSRRDVPAPPHQPGLLPAWLREQGADVVLAGGMGRRAVDLFEEAGIEVVTGVPEQEPESAVRGYLDGSLETGGNVCDH